MSLKTEIRKAKNELSEYEILRERLVEIRGTMYREELPIDISEEKEKEFTEAINQIESLLLTIEASLEAHIDDLENK